MVDEDFKLAVTQNLGEINTTLIYIKDTLKESKEKDAIQNQRIASLEKSRSIWKGIVLTLSAIFSVIGGWFSGLFSKIV